MRLHVAVCAVHGATVERCLAALAAEGIVDPPVHRAPAGEGLAGARNAALADAGDADVLVMVEDDVAVELGWAEALRRAWKDADELVACIGGPIGARVVGERPQWLTDDLVGAMGTMEPIECARTYLGANISFRTEALRGVGGFWPARGHPHARDLLSDEHFAQHELARAGWQSAAAPQAHAVRVVDASLLTLRHVLRQRARLGAREQLIGAPRPRGLAARHAARAAVGSGMSAVRGARARAAERAARAAHLTGAVFPERLARQSVEATTTSTPFRASVPMVTAGAPPARTSGPAVLLYHRVAALESDPLGLAVSPAHFADQLALLREHRDPVPLADLVAGTAGPRAVSLTFDDGYHDNLEHALPLLREHGIPATVFVSTGHVETGRGFWWDAVDRLLTAAPAPAPHVLRMAIGDDLRAWPAHDAAQREEARRHIHAWLQPLPPQEIDAALGDLAQWASVPGGEAPPDRDRPMTVDELRELAADPLITIGAHTRTHRCLRYAPADVQRDEMARSRADLEAWLGAAPEVFSYPFGVPDADFDAVTRGLAQETGFTHAVAIAPGRVSSAGDRYAIPRLVVPDVGGDDFAAWLTGA